MSLINMKKLLFLVALVALISVSCKKTLTPEQNLAAAISKVQANDAAQVATDVEKIKKYITDNKLTATATPEGIYYVTEEAGLGVDFPTVSSSVLARYKGYLLDGTVFDQSTSAITFNLQQVIVGWTIGMQKFKRRSKGKLLIPSPYGYGGNAQGSKIPANSVLIFDIELTDFN
jgi:FKBP-type peptidyl-prolyl cis-trans isomerase FkpA